MVSPNFPLLSNSGTFRSQHFFPAKQINFTSSNIFVLFLVQSNHLTWRQMTSVGIYLLIRPPSRYERISNTAAVFDLERILRPWKTPDFEYIIDGGKIWQLALRFSIILACSTCDPGLLVDNKIGSGCAWLLWKFEASCVQLAINKKVVIPSFFFRGSCSPLWERHLPKHHLFWRTAGILGPIVAPKFLFFFSEVLSWKKK